MNRRAMLIDYEYCTGCKACEIACQKEHAYPLGRKGIVVEEEGPWKIEGDRWQYDFVPVLTDECDLCSERVSAGKTPTCVKHCMASVISVGEVDGLLAVAPDKRKQVLYIR